MAYEIIEAGNSNLTIEPPWTFCCPACRTNLEPSFKGGYVCPQDGRLFINENNIWRFILPERMKYFQKFIQDYESIRLAEGRGSSDRNFYRNLPDRDLSGNWTVDWRIRARSYRAFEQHVLIPTEVERRYPLRILDLGAGNGWLTNKLAETGHIVCAVDILTNQHDGLGTYQFFETKFTSIQAEFDRLPLSQSQVDLVIFNASLHYSTDYLVTLSEAMRVLSPDGALVIMDTPIYRQPSSGDQMVAEREKTFLRKFGFKSNSIQSQNYMTFDQINHLSIKLNLQWRMIYPRYGLHWRLKPWLARLQGWREPAKFILLVGKPRSGYPL